MKSHMTLMSVFLDPKQMKVIEFPCMGHPSIAGNPQRKRVPNISRVDFDNKEKVPCLRAQHSPAYNIFAWINMYLCSETGLLG